MGEGEDYEAKGLIQEFEDSLDYTDSHRSVSDRQRQPFLLSGTVLCPVSYRPMD